ncbi:MAG: hypothetical protein EHM87_19100 [Burkholderiales bacterium]|nr:MAG: hypothetical protein EHM87_19100 [Burkholderiales bacterium]
MDTQGLPAGSGRARRGAHRLARIGLAIGVVAALAGTFRLYLGPDLMLDVGTFMQWCGLR